MHQAHERAGAPQAQFRYAPDLSAGLAAAERFGYPVVIKPALGAASSFVFRADSPADFARLPRGRPGRADDEMGAPGGRWHRSRT